MHKKLATLFDRVWNALMPAEGIVDTVEEDADGIRRAVEQARNEWLCARAYFDNVTDPDLIDHAIYSIEAAERKYMFLLRRAGELGCGAASLPDESDLEAIGVNGSPTWSTVT